MVIVSLRASLKLRKRNGEIGQRKEGGAVAGVEVRKLKAVLQESAKRMGVFVLPAFPVKMRPRLLRGRWATSGRTFLVVLSLESLSRFGSLQGLGVA